jgi:hypothetical protein
MGHVIPLTGYLIGVYFVERRFEARDGPGAF